MKRISRQGGNMMRRLWLVLAVVFAASLYTAAGVQAATYSKSKSGSKMSAKQKKSSMAARRGSGPYTYQTKSGAKWRCYKVAPKAKRARVSRPARVARGPMVTCPTPVVNVPQQAAPVVNVPQGPAPVVNVPPFPPTVGVTVDNCYIYVVQGDKLMVIDKNSYCLKQTIPLTETPATTGAGIGTGGFVAPDAMTTPDATLTPEKSLTPDATMTPSAPLVEEDIIIMPETPTLP